jgi:tetratricopeptide (TPR) repeat protein
LTPRTRRRFGDWKGKEVVPSLTRSSRLLFAVAVGLFFVVMVAGTVQSVRVERGLPGIDLLASGSNQNVRRLLDEKDYDGAIEQLQMQSRLLPSDAATFEYLGSLLGSQSRPEEARAQFQELLRLRPDYAEGYNLLGSTYFDTRDFEMAASCFLKAIELRPKFPQAINNLGKALAQMGKLERAAECFARALELSPDFEEAKVNLDWTRRQLMHP